MLVTKTVTQMTYAKVSDHGGTRAPTRFVAHWHSGVGIMPSDCGSYGYVLFMIFDRDKLNDSQSRISNLKTGSTPSILKHNFLLPSGTVPLW